jgi:hypothetical protein
MKRLALLAVLAALAAALLVAPTASAKVAPGTATVKSGPACAIAGVTTLIKLKLLVPVARNGLNPADLDPSLEGGAFDTTLSLATVVKLHLTNPELFAGTKNGGFSDIFNWCAR